MSAIVEMYGEGWVFQFTPTEGGRKHRCVTCGATGYLDYNAKPSERSWTLLHLQPHVSCEICGKKVTQAGLNQHKAHHRRANRVHTGDPDYDQGRMRLRQGASMTTDVIGGLERLLTKEEVCELLGVKIAWLNTEIQAGRFPYTRLGEKKNIRFTPEQIRRYLATKESEWTPPRSEDA